MSVRVTAALILLFGFLSPAPGGAQIANPLVIYGQDLYDIQQALPVWQKGRNYSNSQLQNVVTYVISSSPVTLGSQEKTNIIVPANAVAFQDNNVTPSVTIVYAIAANGAVSTYNGSPYAWTQVPGYYLASISSVFAYRAANPPKYPVNFLYRGGVFVGLSTPSGESVYKIDIQQYVSQQFSSPVIGCGPNERYIIAESTFAVSLDAPCI